MKNLLFWEKIETAMLKKSLSSKEKVNLNKLAEVIGYNAGSNLGTALKTRRIKDKFLVLICEYLGLDIGKMYKLKVLGLWKIGK